MKSPRQPAPKAKLPPMSRTKVRARKMWLYSADYGAPRLSERPLKDSGHSMFVYVLNGSAESYEALVEQGARAILADMLRLTGVFTRKEINKQVNRDWRSYESASRAHLASIGISAPPAQPESRRAKK